MSEFNFDNNFDEENKKTKAEEKIEEIKNNLESIRNEINILKKNENKNTKDEMNMIDLKIQESEMMAEIDKINYQERNKRRRKNIANLKKRKERIEFKIWKEKNSIDKESNNFSF